MLNYIGITSHQNGGKDFVADYIAQNIERKCQVVKFATKLTEVVAAILGVEDLTLFQDREWKEKIQFIWQGCVEIIEGTGKLISARDAQIKIGTEIMRNIIDPDIWVTAFANAYSDPDILYIASDVRFQNEMDFIQQNNGIMIFIENRKAAQVQHRKEYKDGKHQPHNSEELAWSLYHEDQQADYRLLNNDYENMKPLQDLLTFISTV